MIFSRMLMIHSPGYSYAQFHMCMGAQVEPEAFVETFQACILKQKCGFSKQRHLWTFGALVHQCHVKMQSKKSVFFFFFSARSAARLIKSKSNLQTACLTCGYASIPPSQPEDWGNTIDRLVSPQKVQKKKKIEKRYS